MDEDYLRAHTVGALQPLSGPIVLVDYDPDWPRAFAIEAAKIRSALGPRALRVEHVGSTSVPYLPAKPIIDILLIVRDSADEEDYAAAPGENELSTPYPRTGMVSAQDVRGD